MEQALIERIADLAAGQGVDEASIGKLREAYPQTIFSFCSDDDVTADLPPVAEREGFNVYLIDASSHCLALTGDPANASGLLFATVEEEDE
ncbi:DUF6129 family protein [Endothiovibrio diazotrophicus]